VFAGIGIGMGIGLASAFTGGAAAAGIGTATASMSAAGGMAGFGAATLTGAAAGAAGGFTGGFLNSLAFSGNNGYFSGNVGDAFAAGANGMWKGALTGAASGAAVYGLKVGASALAEKAFSKADQLVTDNLELAQSSKAEAENMTYDFASDELGSNAPDLKLNQTFHNTRYDAFRHEAGSAILTKKYGRGIAKFLTDVYEQLNPNPNTETFMDQSNNWIGRNAVTKGFQGDIFKVISNNIRQGNWVNLAGKFEASGLQFLIPNNYTSTTYIQVLF
jgi:hypothetical protein